MQVNNHGIDSGYDRCMDRLGCALYLHNKQECRCETAWSGPARAANSCDPAGVLGSVCAISPCPIGIEAPRNVRARRINTIRQEMFYLSLSLTYTQQQLPHICLELDRAIVSVSSAALELWPC